MFVQFFARHNTFLQYNLFILKLQYAILPITGNNLLGKEGSIYCTNWKKTKYLSNFGNYFQIKVASTCSKGSFKVPDDVIPSFGDVVAHSIAWSFAEFGAFT